MEKLKIILLIFICALTSSMVAQRKIIKGTVHDESGMPIVGASVLIKGTNTGASSDFDGNFTIESEEKDILLISYLGFVTQEVLVGDQKEINILLKEDVSSLDEIIVVAYGTQKKATITSSIVNIKSEELKDVTTPDVTTMLQGKVAGVRLGASSGSPGSVPNILIRGSSSLGGRVTPLWVVDGVIQHEVPIVNPNDVQSISVLKDASATSLYGSRGANGVIIVTTKRGNLKASEITVSSKVSINRFNTGNFEVMNSQQLYDLHTQFENEQSWFGPELLERDYNWLENGTRDGFVRDVNLSFTSGTEKLNLYINGGYYNETGTLRGNELDRYTYRMNLDYDITKRLKLSPKLSFSFDDRGRVTEAPLYQLYLNLPWDSPYDADGNAINAKDDSDWLGRDELNYQYDQQWNYSSDNVFNLSSNFDFEFQVLPDLIFRSVNNFTYYRKKEKKYTDPRSIDGLATKGSIEDEIKERFTRLTTQTLKYSKGFGEHFMSVLGGYEYNDYEYEQLKVSGNGIIAGTEILNVASEAGDISGFKNDYALQSFFLATDYSYGSRYFAKASVRRDGASNFGLNNQYGNFFALGAGWNVHNEAFFTSNSVNELKLRVSYGSVGNRPSELYPYQGTYRLDTQYIGTPGAILKQLGNPDLSWEKSYEANIAIDARFLNRINATFEYYNKDTSDLLYFVDLPDVTGYKGFWENVGGLTNTGFEAAVSVDILQTKDLEWNVGFNIGVNRNEITELFDGQTEIPRSGGKIFKIGEDSNSWYIRKWLGVDPATGSPLWEVVDPDTGERTETTNWNEATLQIIGTSSPDFIGGFDTRVRYKNLSLSSNFNFTKGGTLYNSARELFDSDGLYPTFNQQVLADDWNRWEKPGDIATHPQVVEGGNNNSNKRSSRYLEDASYLRMTNVTLSYTLPKVVLKKLGLSNFNIYLSGDNLLTFTDFSGVDPAVTGNPNDRSNIGLSGTPGITYPIPKRYALGVNVSF
ncbi:TonB-dependent receptor [Aquimarina sp. TRL1]|uniref:SusC/RagA family TonB-linked outer membrane protein n=1 Tax=Aquimarina sp. (strain TRL1) TaxID=2736252 RepID=UPI0015890F62|nr:TonB-dependent receptor [Aquimarina sp. TRL1]QKX05459.1 TonB-dependent receptor [Aquimarina sp. TRL1]